jgi:hypothetical protein
MSNLKREQVHQIFLQRFSKHLGSPDEIVPILNDPATSSRLRGPGSEIADWHFEAFAEIDDLIKTNPSSTIKVSITEVCDKWAKSGHAHNYDSFEAMYYEFKRDKELEYRKQRFAEQLLAGKADEALEQLYRLSLITDINSLFGTSE